MAWFNYFCTKNKIKKCDYLKPQMLTITVNTFENIDTKFHNDPRKTSGDTVCTFISGGLTLVALLSALMANTC